MSIQHKIYCAHCAERSKKVRLNSDFTQRVEINCRKCHWPSVLVVDDEKAFYNIIEISMNGLWWPRMDKNNEPVFTCPFCTHLLSQFFSKDEVSTNLLSCVGTGCKREFEIEYTD